MRKEFNDIEEGPIFQDVLSPEQYALIGKIVTRLSGIESLMDYSIMELLCVNFYQFKAVTDGKPISAKISLFKELAEIKLDDRDLLHRVNDVCGKMTGVLPERNAIVHGYWGYCFMDGRTSIHPEDLKDTYHPMKEVAARVIRRLDAPYPAKSLEPLLKKVESLAVDMFNTAYRLRGRSPDEVTPPFVENFVPIPKKRPPK